MKGKLKDKRAFTLIELVIVIAVIGVLAVVLIPTFTSVINSAKLANDNAVANNLTKQLAIYNLDGDDIQVDEINYVASKNGINLIPQSKDVHFIYDRADKKIKLVSTAELFNNDKLDSLSAITAYANASFSNDCLEAVSKSNPAYLYCDNSVNEISDTIAKVKELANLNGGIDIAFAEIVEGLTNDSLFKEHIESFNPNNTYYISQSNISNPVKYGAEAKDENDGYVNLSPVAKKVDYYVFAPDIVYLNLAFNGVELAEGSNIKVPASVKMVSGSVAEKFAINSNKTIDISKSDKRYTVLTEAENADSKTGHFYLGDKGQITFILENLPGVAEFYADLSASKILSIIAYNASGDVIGIYKN